MNQTINQSLPHTIRLVLATVLFGLVMASVGLGTPPHPSLLESRAAAQKAGLSVTPWPDAADLQSRGINAPEDCFGLKKSPKEPGQTAAALGTFRVLALLVDFSDNVSSANATFFDTLVFGIGTGTVHDYFDEISYAQIDLVTVNLPSTIGWTRAPQTYDYYVNSNYGMGSSPQNSQGLVIDLVDAVDSQVDFSNYDNDSDGDVDVLLVVHSGTGAERSGSVDDFWSHKWGIPSKLTGDGVYVSAFTIQPEFWDAAGDMTIGVYAHELLHGFGLPDLYDTDDPATDFVSNGIGRWGIMSYGSWNGSLGSSPSHPCAWSRAELGISTPVNVTANLSGQAIPSVESGGSIFRLWTSGVANNEYFLVENRQRTGYDATLPGSGLLIWHIDDAKSTNREEWYPGVSGSHHMLVALEQADGLYELEHKSGTGDADDPWPGNLNRTLFNGASSPSSDGYLTGGTFVAVDNITPSAATMYADLIVGVAAGVEDENLVLPGQFVLAQNYPNPFNPTTQIAFTLASGSTVDLSIYNVLGEKVRTLYDAFAGPGNHYVTWDGTDHNGTRVASGVYLYRLATESSSRTRKMMLLK